MFIFTYTIFGDQRGELSSALIAGIIGTAGTIYSIGDFLPKSHSAAARVHIMKIEVPPPPLVNKDLNVIVLPENTRTTRGGGASSVVGRNERHFYFMKRRNY